MKVPAKTIERADQLIQRADYLLKTVNQVGNIDAHDVRYADARSFIDLLAPTYSLALANVSRKYIDALLGDHAGRANYNLILYQLHVVRCVRDHLHQTDDNTSTRLCDLYFASKNAPSGAAFHEELMTCLFELKICYDNECFAACMALCGKILEIALKRYFDAESIPYGSKDMLGALIQTYRTHRGPSLPHKHIAEVSTIIN